MKYSLSKIATVLVLMIIFFAIVTQRMMITSDNKIIETAKSIFSEIEKRIKSFNDNEQLNNEEKNNLLNEKLNTDYPYDILKEVLNSKDNNVDDIFS